jgi:hypothetical protein
MVGKRRGVLLGAADMITPDDLFHGKATASPDRIHRRPSFIRSAVV